MIKANKCPTVIYRVVDNKTHVLNYTTGEIMSFDINEEDVLELMALLLDANSDVPVEVKKFFAKTGNGPNTRLCRPSLIELGMQFSFPTVVNIELNKNCNLCCLHCYIGNKNLKSNVPSIFENMDKTDINNLLDSLYRAGIFLIVLTGGEPFINKNLEVFLRVAIEKRFVVEIFSNLQHLPEWFSKVDPESSRIGRIQTSVYSSCPRIHDEITTVRGSFKRTMKNLRLIKKRGYYVEIATPLMDKNFKSRNDTIRYFKGMKIRQDFSWPIVNEYQDRQSNKALLNISEVQIKQFAIEHPGFFIRLNIENSKESICAAGKVLLGIMSNGDVWPCSQYPLTMGNIGDNDIDHILNSSGMVEVANRVKRLLDKKTFFNFCMGTNYAETKDPFKQPNFMSKINPCIARGKRR